MIQHPVHNQPQRIDICPMIIFAAEKYFRSHKGFSTDSFGMYRTGIGNHPGQAKVSQLKVVQLINKDISWFDIPVQNVFFFTNGQKVRK